MKRSLKPPVSPENAILWPSGAHVGLSTSSSVFSSISRSLLPRSTSTIVMIGLPPRSPGNANRLLSRDHAPADSMNSRLSRCALVAVSVIFRMTLPVVASATNRSIENRSRDEKKTMREPSGLSSGLTFMPPLWVSSVTSARAKDAGIRVASAIGRNAANVSACHWADRSLEVMPSTRWIAP